MNTATKPKKVAPKSIDLSGLGNFEVSSLMSAGAPEAKEQTGKPLDIPLSDIIEDPHQPRTADNPGFSDESIAELAESIKASGGVKTPISVRSKNADGKYVINHGAGRDRASEVAKMKTIKGFIDDTHDDYDQAIENIQRENFTPMEIAAFIEKREGKGDSKTAIAQRLGKSKSYITQHASLLTMPALLREVYDENVCRDVLALYELTNLNKKHAEAVEKYVQETPEITRSSVEALKASLKAGAKAAADEGDGDEDDEGEGGDGEGEGADGSKEPGTKVKKATLMVKHEKALYVLRLDMRPSALHLGWIEEPDTGKTMEVELADLALDSIVEG